MAVDHDPARAHQLAPYDGRITADLAQKLFVDTRAMGNDSAPARLARQALRADPTAVSAVATLGLQAQLRGDTAGARRYFAYAERLSRRNLQTRLWAIEDAVARDDIPGALRQYDIALRTSSEASELLFPVLGGAIQEPRVRDSLITVLAHKPSWGANFVAYLGATPSNPVAMAQLFAAMRRGGQAVPPEAVAATTNSLFERGETDRAWRFYAMFHPRADRRRSRDPRFVDLPDTSAMFDWVAVNDGGISTSMQRGTSGGVFDFSAPSSTGGLMLQQAQLLPAGEYRLTGHSMDVQQVDQSLPYWVLTCRDGRELGRVVVPSSNQANGMFAGRFAVPANCPAQTLALIARPSDEVGGLSGQFDRVELTPIP